MIDPDLLLNRTDAVASALETKGTARESVIATRDVLVKRRSVRQKLDELHTELKQMNARAIYQQSYRKELEGAKEEDAVHTEEIPDFDKLCRELPTDRQASILRQVKNTLETTKADYDFKAAVLSSDEKEMRCHHTEMHQKFTLSFACLIFFFIGAPLGAIIRKGGLGMPVVISIFLFIFYYVINNIDLKMASNGM